MSSLWLDPKDLACIIDHAEHAYPQECCGLLVGKIQPDRITAIEVYPMANQWEEGDQATARVFEAAMGAKMEANLENGLNTRVQPEVSVKSEECQANDSTRAQVSTQLPTAERRYTIDPRAMLDVQKLARDRGLSIVGIYHSHPEHPAIPSEYDREFAWVEYVYPIVSVRQGHPSAVRVWQLNDDRQFDELELRKL